VIRLIVTTEEESRIVESADPVVTVGRGADSTVHITDEAASRDQCRLQAQPDGAWTLIDLASRNGTRLNGQLIDEHPLKPGDTILIGKTAITVETLAAEPAPAAPDADDEDTELAEAPLGLRLVFAAGPNAGQDYLVTRRITRIGRRKRDNDIALFDTGISNRHAEIRRGPDGFILVDEGSKNGTLLNGERVRRSPIRPGDQIQLGRTLIEVHAAAASAEAPAPVSVPPEEEAAEDETDEAAGALPGSRIALLVTAIVVVLVAVGAVYVVRHIAARRARQASGDGNAHDASQSPDHPDAGGDLASADPLTAERATELATQLKADLAAAERLALQKRYGEAIRRFGEIAQHYASTEARKRATELEDEAREQLAAALRLLKRAELTGEPADFDAARQALEAARAPFKDTSCERELAQALERSQAERLAAAGQRRDAEAAALLLAARERLHRKEPHIARLQAQELLARFPESAAAADAKALLADLDAPPTPPKEK